MARPAEGPLYKTLAEQIRERIQGGDLVIGGQIPTEHALCAEYGVSRTTVRQAVQELVLAGVLDRQQGRGTFVRAASVGPDQFYHPLPKQAFHFTFVESGWAAPAFELASAFATSVNQEVFSMTRLRLDNAEPVAVTRYASAAPILRADPPTPDELANATFDAILYRRGVRSLRSNIMSEPIRLAPIDAELLGAPADALSIATQRIGFDRNDKAVRFSRTIMRPDRARLFWSLRHTEIGGPAETREFSSWTATVHE